MIALKMKLSTIDKSLVPNVLHFLWIGDLNEVKAHYIEIWQKTNKDKDVFFWCDSDSSLCKLLNTAIIDFVNTKRVKDKLELELEIKNSAFNYIYPKIKEGFTFDDLVIEFLDKNKIPYQRMEKKIKCSWFEKRGVIKKNIADIFCADLDDFMKYYYYEIILRCNLASASDIVRLLIIYQYGGVYIDIDTLPCTNDIYCSLNKYIEKERIIESDSFLLFKTKLILNKIGLDGILTKDAVDFDAQELSVDADRFETINRLIRQDISNFSLDMIPSLGNMYVYKNLLALGTLKRLKGVYFNNFMSSHKRSKAIKIILMVMKKRYRFLERNDCIFSCYTGGEAELYLSRLLTWRTELITKNYCVTSALTGPGLIVEVLLGLAYDIFKIESSVEPSYIAEYMQNPAHGIALLQHNIDTPDGIYSAWRK